MEPKRRRRLSTHRWTELETFQLLLEVSKDVQKRATAFEKPTSERFYAKIANRNKCLKHIAWKVMRAKMRYLRGMFIAENLKSKHLSHKDRHMEELMCRKCPHYDILEQIFGRGENVQAEYVQSGTEFHANVDVFSDSKDADDIEEFSDHVLSETSKIEKKKRLRQHKGHFWSDEETAMLINYVLEGIGDDPKKFEKPCSRVFYETHCKQGILDKLEWPLMKNKMRYFRVLYLKAEKWLEDVGTELFESDAKHITTRLNSICPYYDKLKPLFESQLPTDPIRVSWNGTTARFPVHNEQSNDANNSVENTERLFKIENDVECEDSIMHSDAASFTEGEGADGAEEDDLFSNKHLLTPKVQYASTNEEETNFRKNGLELQREKLKFERHKFEHEYEKFEYECEHRKSQNELQRLHLELEKEKLEFEKQKLRAQDDLKKHEIDQNFILKKLQLEKDERMQRIQLEKEERLQRIELEYKYKLQTNMEQT